MLLQNVKLSWLAEPQAGHLHLLSTDNIVAQQMDQTLVEMWPLNAVLIPT